MRLMYNGKELDETLGPKFKAVLLWSTPPVAVPRPRRPVPSR